MTTFSLEKELKENSYPGRGIVIGRSADGKHAVTAYFIMGRSENSRNRVFVENGEETVFLLRMVRESAHRHLTRPNLQTRA
mgnify:CR=1 FL=1